MNDEIIRLFNEVFGQLTPMNIFSLGFVVGIVPTLVGCIFGIVEKLIDLIVCIVKRPRTDNKPE